MSNGTEARDQSLFRLEFYALFGVFQGIHFSSLFFSHISGGMEACIFLRFSFINAICFSLFDKVSLTLSVIFCF